MPTGAQMILYLRIENLKNLFHGTHLYSSPYMEATPPPPFLRVSCSQLKFIFLRKLDSLLKPDRKRADELKEEFAKGFNGIVKRLWPHVNLVLACSTGILNY